MKYPQGVYPATKKDGSEYYRASITYRMKHISLGSFESENLAHQAYKQARNVLDTKVRIDDYLPESALPFEKWVSLINARDNGIYIKTPIYICKNFFYYYTDVNTHYTFDVDDLFYYSTHKIMNRGNYLFVSDYGMQLNILSRYGIKNYAVCGRDYLFVNGNNKDYRYKNILIINKYYGVFEFMEKGIKKYKTIIHLYSNHVVGTYKTETEAAIAYNKAVDYLHTQGIKKNFNTNYIDIGAIEYASVYTSVRISKKLRNQYRKAD